MSDTREEIAEVLRIVARNAISDYRNLGYDYRDKDDAEDFAEDSDKIIAIVREAMLGEPAMSVARGIEIDMEGAYGMSENTVPAMLDAIGLGESNG